jgi:hypothetical protein
MPRPFLFRTKYLLIALLSTIIYKVSHLYVMFGRWHNLGLYPESTPSRPTHVAQMYVDFPRGFHLGETEVMRCHQIPRRGLDDEAIIWHVHVGDDTFGCDGGGDERVVKGDHLLTLTQTDVLRNGAEFQTETKKKGGKLLIIVSLIAHLMRDILRDRNATTQITCV